MRQPVVPARKITRTLAGGEIGADHRVCVIHRPDAASHFTYKVGHAHKSQTKGPVQGKRNGLVKERRTFSFQNPQAIHFRKGKISQTYHALASYFAQICLRKAFKC